jgi:hypothetical protein
MEATMGQDVREKKMERPQGRLCFDQRANHICCNTNHIHPKVEENIIITGGYASQPKERAICQLVRCNTNKLKAVTQVTSHDRYINVVAHKTKEREIVPHVCCNT